MNIQISIDATKIDKKLMREKDGKPTYLELDVIALKEPKQKTKADGTPIQGIDWKLMKTHFITQKKPKGQEEKMPIIGEGTVFEKNITEPLPDPVKEEVVNEIDADSIPF